MQQVPHIQNELDVNRLIKVVACLKGCFGGCGESLLRVERSDNKDTDECQQDTFEDVTTHGEKPPL